MEGVGARFGRSSTRYGPTTVFTGPVRRWKKKWVHVSSSKNNHQSTAANGRVNGSNVSHLVFLKWTPITASQNNNNNNSSADKDGDSKSPDKDDDVPIEEPPKRKFKYIPVALLENQNNETSDQDEDEAKPMVADANTGEPTSQADDCDEKPDINDVPMEENQDPEDKPPERQDLNENTLDLSLESTGQEEKDADSKTIQTEEDKLDKVN
ncbi:transcription initiation factor TFIID subunit 11-like [Solanum pennellii]|uniref:Transcription initiation factor TFIID subunit 11-like n=2 Tax=Solanum subgen. Lycopersicon TaxID=49274 RepID=A0ABM1FKW0_SOLPN|nr:transcription initiation factor TFIID subunit 11-like [Solanum pennellii]TMW82316.1 hypothetical protein EJD97_006270 [Solanum chilense]